MSDNKTHCGYAGVRKNDEGRVVGFSIGGDLEQVKTTTEHVESDKPVQATETLITLKDRSSALLLEATVNKIVDPAQSQFELLFMTPLLNSLSSSIFLGRDIIEPLEKANCVIEQYNNTTIFGLSQDMFRHIAPKFERL